MSSSKIGVVFLSAGVLTREPFSQPSELEKSKLQEEFKKVDEKLTTFAVRQHFDLQPENAVSIENLIGTLVQCKPKIIHFSGYAIKQDNGQSSIQDGTPSTYITDYFVGQGKYVRCVLMSACYTDKQAKEIAKEIAKYVDCVIGFTNEVCLEAASKFASNFY